MSLHSRSSSSMSYNGSSLSDASNKATPSYSTSRHVHRDKGQLVAAFSAVGSGRELSSPPFDGISNLCFSNHSDHLLLSSWDMNVGRYDFNTSKEDRLGCHKDPIRCVEYSHATGQVITSNWDKTITGVVFEPFVEVQNQLVKIPSTSTESFARQSYTSAYEAAINTQINVEYNVSYAYHNLFAFFDRDNVGLPRFASAKAAKINTHAVGLLAVIAVSGNVACLTLGKRKMLILCAVVPLPDLKADDFNHPLDRQNTMLLRTIPTLNELGKLLLGPVAEQVMLLENIGTSILVSEEQLPELLSRAACSLVLTIDPMTSSLSSFDLNKQINCQRFVKRKMSQMHNQCTSAEALALTRAVVQAARDAAAFANLHAFDDSINDFPSEVDLMRLERAKLSIMEPYKGIINCFTRTVKEEGIISL